MKKHFKFTLSAYPSISIQLLLICVFNLFCTIINAQTVKKPETFSALEIEMDKLALQYGRQADVALAQLKSLDQKTVTVNDFAVLNAYRCFLSMNAKKDDIFQQTHKDLKKKESITSSDLVSLAAVQAAIGICDFYHEPNEQKREHILARAYHYVKSSQAPTLRYWISIMYSELTSRQGRARDAIAAATIALEVARTNNDTPRQAESLRTLAMMEIDFADKKSALSHINEAIALRSSVLNNGVDTEYLLNRAFILTQLKDYKEAYKAYREIELVAIKLGQKHIPPIAWSNYADIFYLQGNFQQAQLEVNHILKWASQNNDDRIANYAKITGALLAIERQDIVKAQQLFDEAIIVFQNEKSYVEMREFYRSLATGFARNGFYKQAFSALEKQSELSQQIDMESRGHAANELRELLKTEEREKENISLLAEIERNKLNMQRWGFLAAFLFLGLLYLYQLFTQARRRNSILQLENNELDTERYQDPLTLLYNRRFIVKNRIGIWQKTLQQKAATLMIDADHFKRINDEHGHAAGDAALIEIARRIKLSVRESDITVRWGGEEFVVFSFACNADQVKILAARIIEELRIHPFYFEGKAISLSASIGYVLLPLKCHANDYLNLEDSIKLADTALYLSKNRGRNRAIGVESIKPTLLARSHIFGNLQLAWDRGDAKLIEVIGPKS